jgi:two-component system response regulator MprA
VQEHRHTVLVVDDHEDVRESLETFLCSMGCSVVTACEGEEALDRLRGGEVRPCIILLDLMMPKLDGWQFRQAQLADPALADIPVIAVSAYYPLRERAAGSGIEAVLAKPVDPDELLGFLERYCAAA